MGFFSDIFGGGDSSTTPVSTLSPPQAKINRAFGKWLLDYVGQGATPYPGEAPVAELTPDQQQAFQMIRDQVLGGGNVPLSEEVSRSYRDILLGEPSTTIDTQTTQNLINAIQAPQARTFYEETLPKIQEQFTQTGTFGSMQAGDVARKSIQEFEGGQNEVAAVLKYADEQERRDLIESARERALKATPYAGEYGLNLSKKSIQDAQTLAQIGEVQRLLNQANLSWDVSEFMRTQPEYAPYIDMILNYLGIDTIENITEPSESGMLGIGYLLGGLGGGGKGDKTEEGDTDWLKAAIDAAKIAAMVMV